ncbi:hypothetical protein [Thalassotalea hakodatensis]|uniref:hypothetical protein n=1 Tax=Thalassotalea hakodatensis TaxID=3030492 RepID=UPI002572AC3B|nr:hypothetical protein [Thalassotalea hakodatensis]
MYTLNDLERINQVLVPLKETADRERQAIWGLTGYIDTPHIDAYNKVCVEKARILKTLKEQNLLPYSNVEVISKVLMVKFKTAKSAQVCEYNDEQYQCRFAPLKLSKSGKIVRKWAKYWLKLLPNGSIDVPWQNEVKEIWPEYFIIRTMEG